MGRAWRFHDDSTSVADFWIGAGNWSCSLIRCPGTAASDRTVHQPFLLRAVEHGAGVACRKPPGNFFRTGAGRRRADYWFDGPLRIGANTRARDSGGHRSDSDQRKPCRTEGRIAQADFFGDLHWFGRTFWRGGPDHHDRRSDRIDDRPTVPPDERRAQDLVGGRGRGWNVGDIRSTRCFYLARGGIASVRMETSQLGSRGIGQRDRSRAAALSFRIWALVSGAGAPTFHRAESSSRVRFGRFARRSVVGFADHVGLRCGRRISAFADSLDVVANDRRAGDWLGRVNLSAGAGGRLRHHWRVAARQCDHARDPWRVACQMVHLGGIAWLGNIRRCFGAVAHDGRSTRRSRNHVPS